MSGLGHNGGPTLEPGAGWRRYAWRRARQQLLPKLPLEVVRMRIRRARALGLDYKSYASVRAGTGRDIVALLFSSNALRAGPTHAAVPEDEARKLAAVTGADRLAFVHLPHDPARFLAANPALDAAARAPGLSDSWSGVREAVTAFTTQRGLPGDAVVVIGATALEREWAEAGRLAGFLPAEAWIGPPAE